MGGLLAFPKSGQLTYVPFAKFPDAPHVVPYQGDSPWEFTSNGPAGERLSHASPCYRKGVCTTTSKMAKGCNDRGRVLAEDARFPAGNATARGRHGRIYEGDGRIGVSRLVDW